MASSKKSNDAPDYIRDKIRAGKFLIKSIHQRQQNDLQHRESDLRTPARVSRQGRLRFCGR